MKIHSEHSELFIFYYVLYIIGPDNIAISRLQRKAREKNDKKATFKTY